MSQWNFVEYPRSVSCSSAPTGEEAPSYTAEQNHCASEGGLKCHHDVTSFRHGHHRPSYVEDVSHYSQQNPVRHRGRRNVPYSYHDFPAKQDAQDKNSGLDKHEIQGKHTKYKSQGELKQAREADSFQGNPFPINAVKHSPSHCDFRAHCGAESITDSAWFLV